jgi:NitT/TauT family transport system substrate-binding protein
MLKRALITTLGVIALAAGVAACGGSGGSSSNASGSSNLPTVKMMVGGIDKQIYLPYQLAQQLGYYKKYGVNVQLSTEQNGGVGAETAMASGQVDMAGAWYVHTIDFQAKGKDVINLIQLSGAPGERIMCAKGSGVNSPAQWKGKTVGVTDIGSGTDNLTTYLAARNHLTTKDFSRAAVGAGPTFVAALQHKRIVCGMTSQPTAGAIQNKGTGYSAIDLASTSGAQKWLGGVYPAAGLLARADWVNSHKDAAQKVVTALVATMHWIHTHSAAQIADKMPAGFVSNGLTTKQLYTQELAQDKGQFLPDGMMPATGPTTAFSVDKLAGNVKGSVDLAKTYTNQFVIAANKQLGF